MTKTEMALEPMEPELARLAQDIDAATDRGDAEALVQLGQRCMEWIETSHGKRTSKLWYFRSNVHAALQQLQEERSWKWRQPHRERTILCHLA
jgi:hypothetical protein